MAMEKSRKDVVDKVVFICVRGAILAMLGKQISSACIIVIRQVASLNSPRAFVFEWQLMRRKRTIHYRLPDQHCTN